MQEDRLQTAVFLIKYLSFSDRKDCADMAVKMTMEPYKNYGNCVKLENGVVELYVTVDLGPRVIHYSTVGGENLFCTDLDRVSFKKGPEMDAAFYPGAEWYIYGGHRLWVSPESFPYSYYPDNDPVAYEEIENGVRLVNRPQIANNRQYTIELTLDPDSSQVTVRHAITNTGDTIQQFAPWSLNVMDKGGVEIIPVTQRETGLLPNRTLTLWDYSAMNDPRVRWGKKFITLRQDVNCTGNFKLGLSNEDGYACLLNKGCVFICRFDYLPGADYPDGGCSMETFTNDFMTEIESVGPMRSVNPGDTVCHTERWELKPVQKMPDLECEDSIEQFIAAYVK